MPNRNELVAKIPRHILEQLKQETAAELGIQNYHGYLGNLPARINGAVGGHMVRKMIRLAEKLLADHE